MTATSVGSGFTRARPRTEGVMTGGEVYRGSGFTRARPRTVRRWPTYNLFRRRAEPDLVCAVPNDFPVPAFVTGEAWTYAGSIDAPSAAPPGFSAEMAERGAETCGFHLFHQLPAAAAAVDAWRAA